MALSREDRIRIRYEIVELLRTVHSYYEQDILNEWSLEGPDRTVLWDAREILRLEDGVDFGPMRKKPGNFERKDWKQIGERASKQRAKGTRAHRRARERLVLAASLAPDTQKERLNDAADRIATRLAFARAKKT